MIEGGRCLTKSWWFGSQARIGPTEIGSEAESAGAWPDEGEQDSTALRSLTSRPSVAVPKMREAASTVLRSSPSSCDKSAMSGSTSCATLVGLGRWRMAVSDLDLASRSVVNEDDTDAFSSINTAASVSAVLCVHETTRGSQSDRPTMSVNISPG